MLCLILESTDPFFNLATEESLFKKSEREYFLLCINNTSVIIGKHQVPHMEVNTRFITENKIPVIRRISGGGTVFHDTGNLNFSFIRNSEYGRQVDFRKYTQPVRDFLSSCGINAEFGERNDLTVGGLKISGNAEHVHRTRVLHHGTLLFNTSLDTLKGALRDDKSSYTTRAVQSNRASVLNLQKELINYPDILSFCSAMMSYFLKYLPDAETYKLTDSEKEEADILVSTRYKTWEWNWAYGPEYHFAKRFELSGKEVNCNMFIKDGMIADCAIEGPGEIAAAGRKLVGCRHMVDDMFLALNKEKFLISREDIFKFF